MLEITLEENLFNWIVNKILLPEEFLCLIAVKH